MYLRHNTSIVPNISSRNNAKFCPVPQGAARWPEDEVGVQQHHVVHVQEDGQLLAVGQPFQGHPPDARQPNPTQPNPHTYEMRSRRTNAKIAKRTANRQTGGN